MIPVDIIFYFSARLSLDESSTDKLNNFCQTLQNKFLAKNPDVKVSGHLEIIGIDFIYANVCTQYIIDKETLDSLIADIENGIFNSVSNEYHIYDSLF